MARRVCMVLALAALATGEVDVFNCCPDGMTVEQDHSCKVAPKSSWFPKIYYQEMERFFDHKFPEDWKIRENAFPKCDQGEDLTFFSSDDVLVKDLVILDDGRLVIQATVAIDPAKYCFNVAGFFVCKSAEDMSTAYPRVKKCCGQFAVFSNNSSACKVHSEDLVVPNITLVEGFPDCSKAGKFINSGTLGDTHTLLPDGTLRYKNNIIHDFCIENVLEHPKNEVDVFTCLEDVEASSQRDDLRFTIYPIALILSVFFLAITLVASCLLPSTYHVLHWRCQTNYVACLLVGDFLLAVTQLSGSALGGPACIAIAIAMHFMFLATFFWLNTMCFNIWWTFRDFRPSSLDRGQEACRLRFYELYAWGGPLLIAGLAAMSDLVDDSYPKLIKPRFGEKRCWFYGDTEVFSYFFGPIAVLLLLNLTLFLATTRELTCGLWKTEVVKSNTERATLGRVCLKLVVVMGVTWVTEVVSWSVGGPPYLWYIPDIINSLQGVLIFAVVGCQPQVLAGLKRLWCCRKSPGDGNHARSSSSNALQSCGEQNTSTTKGMEPLC